MQGLYTEMVQPTSFIQDTVEFLMGRTALRSKPLLFKIFQLACLCLDERFPNLPPVRIGSVNNDDLTSRHIEVNLPVQSYLKNVPYIVETATTDEFVSKFLQYETVYGSLGVSDTYCPWTEVNRYDRSRM